VRRQLYLTGLLALLLAPATAIAQRPGRFGQRPLPAVGAGSPAQPAPGPGMTRRQQLQEQVFARFMERASQRLGLSPADRLRLEQVLRANEAQRRQLARQARAVRQALAAASRDPGTPQGEYERLLRQMADLRGRDLALWRNEQAQLSKVLTPRQRAQFMAMRIEFFEMVQRMRQRRAQADAGGPGVP